MPNPRDVVLNQLSLAKTNIDFLRNQDFNSRSGSALLSLHTAVQALFEMVEASSGGNATYLEVLPPEFVALEGDAYGSIELGTILEAGAQAQAATRLGHDFVAEPDSIQSLRESVNLLAGAVGALTDQLVGIYTGVDGRRIVARRN